MVGEGGLVPKDYSFQELAGLAMSEGDEGWDRIDRVLPTVAQDPQFVIEAARNLRHEDDDVRDLAASVFEATDIDPGPEVLGQLREGMEGDTNPYTRYRSAFALFHHGDHGEDVVNVIKEAAEDPETEEIAKGYLKQLETEKDESPET